MLPLSFSSTFIPTPVPRKARRMISRRFIKASTASHVQTVNNFLRSRALIRPSAHRSRSALKCIMKALLNSAFTKLPIFSSMVEHKSVQSPGETASLIWPSSSSVALTNTRFHLAQSSCKERAIRRLKSNIFICSKADK